MLTATILPPLPKINSIPAFLISCFFFFLIPSLLWFNGDSIDSVDSILAWFKSTWLFLLFIFVIELIEYVNSVYFNSFLNVQVLSDFYYHWIDSILLSKINMYHSVLSSHLLAVVIQCFFWFNSCLIQLKLTIIAVQFFIESMFIIQWIQFRHLIHYQIAKPNCVTHFHCWIGDYRFQMIKLILHCWIQFKSDFEDIHSLVWLIQNG